MIEIEEIRNLTREQCLKFYDEILGEGNKEAIRWLARNDRFFLLGCLMCRDDVLASDWCYERCREDEKSPDGWLDLWSRFHYKSTVKTLAGSVQEILKDPNITIGILSYNKAIAKKFVDQIRRALESDALKYFFPDILWQRPPQKNWSTQDGLIVKRSSNPKEPTVQGSGLVDGQPIGAHYALRIYDDVVTRDSVSTPEQIKKTTEAWELSLALGTSDGGRSWYVGTRYHPSDTYSVMIERGAVKERRRLCVDSDGNPTLMTKEALEKLHRDMGQITWAAQMLQNPVGDGVRVFKDEWLHYYHERPTDREMNVAVLIDSANSKKRSGDYTTMWVVGLGTDRNYYLLDGVHDKLNLTERTDKLFELEQRWGNPKVFWEQVGAMSDVQHVQEVQDRDHYHFPITPISQHVPKEDRIKWLEPLFNDSRIWLPTRLVKPCSDGSTHDLVYDLIQDEYSTYPTSRHDDMLDCLANICHPDFNVRFPAHSSRGARPTNWVKR